MLRRLRHFATSWFGGVATCGLIGAIAGLAIMFGGLYNTGADNPHLTPVGWAIHQTMISSVRKRADEQAHYPTMDRALLLSGARVYEAHCLACHGGPGVTRAPWVAGMLPSPPYLIDSRSRWSHAQLVILVAHGVKMSGMPAWREILSDQDIADVVSFVEAMPHLTATQYARVRMIVRAQPTSPLDASGPGASIAPLPLDKTQPLSRVVRPASQAPTNTSP